MSERKLRLNPIDLLSFKETVTIPEIGHIPYRSIEHPTIQNIRAFKTKHHASLVYAYDMYRLAQTHPHKRFNLPSGETQKIMYAFLPILSSIYQNNPFKDISVSPLDEYYPIHPKHPDSFTTYHNQHIGLLHPKIDHIQGHAPNVENELKRLNRIISIDPGIVSAFGTDSKEGHIAFVPPSTPFETRGYIHTQLTESTFQRDTQLRGQTTPRGAITQTFNTTHDADHLLIAGWGTKGNTFNMAFFDQEPTEHIPLSVMQIPEIGKKISVYMDAEAGFRYLFPEQAKVLTI